MLCSSWEAQWLAGAQRSGDIALQMAQRGQRKRAVQAQLGVREAGLPVESVCVCVYFCVSVRDGAMERNSKRKSERGMHEGVCVMKERLGEKGWVRERERENESE